MEAHIRRINLTILWMLIAMMSGCESAAPPRINAQKLPGEPLVRVRIARQAPEIQITGPRQVQVYSLSQPDRRQLLNTPIRISRAAGQWSGPWPDRPPDGRAVLVIEPLGPAPLYLAGGASYPGHIRLVPLSTERDPYAAEHFDVINHVRLEAYLPGVLDMELYDHWSPAAYLAQAIAARTYAIDRIIADGPGRHFDVESTQASQAYQGRSLHPLALRATADTAGLVLTWEGKVITAYYSSTCGGARQSAADAFALPRSIPPLEPRDTHTWCVNSRYYRWGPIERDRVELSRRIAAWGKHHGVAIARLRVIQSIAIHRRNHLGRPVEFMLTDDRGTQYVLRAESMRTACNFGTAEANLDSPSSGELIRSSHIDVTVRGDQVVFTEGRGFGHGVGLCQYGAEGMARAGKDAMQILGESYLGAKVSRAY